MLKIPTFVLGGLLILTGLTSYFLQAPSLSIKIKGRLADDTKLTFSDGTQTQTAKTVYLSEIESASFQAKEIIESFYGETTFDSIFPAGPASKAAGENIAIDQASMDPAGIKSFWYASSRKDTLEALIQRTENEHNKDPDFEEIPVNWAEVDVNSSTIKFVYVNAAGNSGPATLQISNWKNIDFANPPENNTLEFGKSKTALIPSLIGLILILLVMAAEAKPSARKHIMHLTVLLGLVAFFMLAKMFGPAFAEMTWLRGDPNSIQHYCTIIKPITMLASAGLLLIFVILCVVSFIQARKEKVAQAKRDSLAKKKAGKGQFENKEEKKAKGSKGISGSTKSKDGEQNTPKGSNTKNDSSKPQKPGYSGGSTNKPTSSDAKGLPASKSVDKKKGTTVTEEKKDSGKKDIVLKEKPRNKTSDDPEKRKGSEQKSNKDAPTATSKELKETKKKENITDSGTKKTSEEDKGFSYKKTDDKGDNSGVRRDSSEDSPEKK